MLVAIIFLATSLTSTNAMAGDGGSGCVYETYSPVWGYGQIGNDIDVVVDGPGEGSINNDFEMLMMDVTSMHEDCADVEITGVTLRVTGTDQYREDWILRQRDSFSGYSSEGELITVDWKLESHTSFLVFLESVDPTVLAAGDTLTISIDGATLGANEGDTLQIEILDLTFQGPLGDEVTDSIHASGPEMTLE